VPLILKLYGAFRDSFLGQPEMMQAGLPPAGSRVPGEAALDRFKCIWKT